MFSSGRGVALRAVGALLMAAALSSPAAEPPLPAAGKLLIATSKMHDPDFAKSVVLVIYSDANGVMGLMINRLTETPLVHLFPELKGKAVAQAPVYLGGLVAQGARGLIRPPLSPPQGTKQVMTVFGEVRVVSNADAIAALATSGARSDRFRVYAGYVGWTSGQLRGEMQAGHWTVATATEANVFDSHPETLWQRLTAALH